MNTKHIPNKPLDYDPYEFDCAGSHYGESVEVELPSGPNVPSIILKIQQTDSGLGPSWTIYVDGTKKLEVFYDDGGEFVLLRDDV